MAPQRERFEVDYYKVLDVSSQATDKEITRAYRKLAKQYHPDSHPGSEDRFKEISAAYDVLGDATKRKEYDEVRRSGPAASGFGSGGTTGGFDFNVEDIFGGLFGGGSRARRRPSPGAGPQRGTDVEANLHLSFNEAVEGAVTTVSVTTPIPCSTCGGSGSKPGTMPVVCPACCGGAGVINDNQGMFSLSTPCPECRGRGTKVVDPCPTCFGTGQQRRERKVKVRIPAGVADAQRIKVKGHGEPGRNGGPNGDLYVTVDVAPHPLFGRRGADLTLTVPVTFAEAALGAEITVPSLDQPVTLRLPPGTSSGKRFRVAGKGLNHSSKHGDLLVTVEVVVPAEITPEQREAIDALAKATPTSPRSYLGV